MRNYLALLITLVFLTACGGGSSGSGSTGSTGSNIPLGSVSGASFDGLIINGAVSVYDFTTGARGALLGQTQSDGNGLYSLSLQVETRPVLIEVTGGYYVEEAGNPQANVSLTSNHILTAVTNYTTGSALAVAVTTYSHLAAGLAAYQINHGTAVTTAISNANTRVSSLVGVNILTTTPKEITDIANASATLTPSLRYGFLAGAISDWTYNNAPSGVLIPHIAPYSSIDFAQLLYEDIAADGLLDGLGSGGAQLSFGSVPLSVDVYRLGIGTSIVRIAASINNKTGLKGANVLTFAQSYIASTDPIFNNVTPTPFAAATAGITSPATDNWARKTISVVPSATSPFGIDTVELVVDGTSVSTSTGAVPASFSLNTAAYADGAHTLTVRSTDLGGFVTTANITSKIDNTPPTSTGMYVQAVASGGYIRHDTGTASDAYSGIASATLLTSGAVYAAPANSSSFYWNIPIPILTSPGDTWSNVRIRDNAGNCTDYGFSTTAPSSLSLLLVGYGTCP